MVQPLIVCHSCKKIKVKYDKIDQVPLCEECYKIRASNNQFDFIAIDFEIANNKMSSACSLGMVFVKNNEIIDEKYYLIQPPTLEFNEAMVKIHGLTASDVKDAKQFHEVWKEIESYFNGNTIIAHNAQFDMSVLHCCLTQYSLHFPEFPYMDSIEISSFVVPAYVPGGLKKRADFFKIELNNHHNAIADARVCAQLVTASIESAKKDSLSAFCQKYHHLSVKQFSNLRPQTHFRNKAKFTAVAISEIAPTVETINVNHPFFMKNIVFTGDLRTLERKDAMQKAVNVGGIVKSSVSSKTNFLVVGVQDVALVGVQGRSSKEKKAIELIEKGKELKIIYEDEFLHLVDAFDSLA